MRIIPFKHAEEPPRCRGRWHIDLDRVCVGRPRHGRPDARCGRGGDGGAGAAAAGHADEAELDAFGEGFEEVGEAETEVDVVDGGRAEGFDGFVDEGDGDGDFLFGGTEGECL